MVSINDVAARAGVSVATVSRALRGLPNVATSTRERVERAADDLDYVPDPSASRLAARRTATIGLAVPDLGTWYHAQLFAGVQRASAAADHDVLPFVIGGVERLEEFVRELPFRKRVDGLLVADLPMGDEEVAHVASAGVPVVVSGGTSAVTSSLGIDDVAAARLAVDHLVELGHTELAVLGGDLDDPLRSPVAQRRRTGVRAALADHGLRLADEHVVPGALNLAGGAAAMRSLLARGRCPAAVFALCDEMALGAMHTLDTAGLRVPEDVSVIGFDDHAMSAYLGLTTIRQRPAAHGARATDRLLALIGQPPSPRTHETLPVELIVRSTTAPPSGGSASINAVGTAIGATRPKDVAVAGGVSTTH